MEDNYVDRLGFLRVLADFRDLLVVLEEGQGLSSGNSEEKSLESVLLIDIDCACDVSNLDSLVVTTY